MSSDKSDGIQFVTLLFELGELVTLTTTFFWFLFWQAEELKRDYMVKANSQVSVAETQLLDVRVEEIKQQVS